MAQQKVYHTKNLSFAAYLLMKGLELHAGRLVPNGNGPKKYKFTFLDPNGDGEKISLEFANSESSRHDENVRFLKNFVYDRRENGNK